MFLFLQTFYLHHPSRSGYLAPADMMQCFWRKFLSGIEQRLARDFVAGQAWNIYHDNDVLYKYRTSIAHAAHVILLQMWIYFWWFFAWREVLRLKCRLWAVWVVMRGLWDLCIRMALGFPKSSCFLVSIDGQTLHVSAWWSLRQSPHEVSFGWDETRPSYIRCQEAVNPPPPPMRPVAFKSEDNRWFVYLFLDGRTLGTGRLGSPSRTMWNVCRRQSSKSGKTLKPRQVP